MVGKILDYKGGLRVIREVERFFMVDKFDGVNVNKVDRVFEFFGKRFEFFDKFFVGRSFVGVGKEVGDGNILFGVRIKVFGRDFVK